MNKGNFGTFAESFMGSLGKNILLGQQMEENKKKRKIQELLTSGNPEDIQKAYLMSGDPKGGLDYQKLIRTESANQDIQRVLSNPNLTDKQKREAMIDFSARTGDLKTWYEQTKPRINLEDLGKSLKDYKKGVSLDEGGQVKGITLSEREDKELNLPPDIDTFGMLKLGKRYSTTEGRAEIMEYLGTPEGRAEYENWWDKRKTTVAPAFTFIPTSEGIVPGNIRSGQAGQPTGFGKPLPGEQIKTGTELNTLKDTIGRIERNYSKSYLGPVSGRLGGIKEKVTDLPEQQARLYADTRDLADAVLRARSGAQINEQEYARLMKFLPDINLPSGQFRVRVSRFKEELESIMKNRERELRIGGYGNRSNQSSTDNLTPTEMKMPTTSGKQEWIENGVRYRINPATGKKQKWVE